MCLGGGGGQTSTNEFKPPSYTQQPWQDYITNAQNLSQAGLQPYAGQTVANQSPMQDQGLQMQSAFTTQGSPERTAGGQAIVGAENAANSPYATANPFAGDNPYLQDMINRSNSLITDQYQRVTEPGANAAAARAGSFGGSDWQRQKDANQQQLLGTLGANTNALLGQNYNQSAQLAESGLNRSLNAAQIGLGQQAADQSAITNMIQGGAIPQQYQQQLLNASSGYYGAQQQAPFTLQDFLGSALSRASGGQGTNTYTGPGQSPLMGLLGAGAAGYGLSQG